MLEVSDVASDQGNLISSRNSQQYQCKVSPLGCSFQETTPPDTLTLTKPPEIHVLQYSSIRWRHEDWQKNAMAAKASRLPDQIKPHFPLYKDNFKITLQLAEFLFPNSAGEYQQKKVSGVFLPEKLSDGTSNWIQHTRKIIIFISWP